MPLLFRQNMNRGNMCYIKLWSIIKVTTSSLLRMTFQQHIYWLPRKNVKLNCLSKVWGSQSFYHTLILPSSKFFFCRSSIIMNYISTLILKIVSLFSCLPTKNNPLCLIRNQIYVLSVSNCLQGQTLIQSDIRYFTHWKREALFFCNWIVYSTNLKVTVINIS